MREGGGRERVLCLEIISSLFSKTIRCTMVLTQRTPLPETCFASDI